MKSLTVPHRWLSRVSVPIATLFLLAPCGGHATEDVYPKERLENLPEVTMTRLKRLKIGLPDGWVLMPSEANDDEAMVHARLYNEDLRARLLIFKFPWFYSFDQEAKLLKDGVDASIPNNTQILGAYNIKKRLIPPPPRFAGYHGTGELEGVEVPLQMYVAYRIQQGFSSKYGLMLFGTLDIRWCNIFSVISI